MNYIDKRPKIGVACILQKEGKVLLGKRKGTHGAGSWAPPGGHLEFGESVADCATRELMEETGIQASSLHLGPWVENIMENGEKHYVTIFVLIDTFLGEPALLEPDKCETWEWFSLNDLPSPLFASIHSLIAKEPDLFHR